MKVLHLIDSAGVYGAEKVMLSLACEQARRGLDVTIGSIAAPGVEKDIESAARSCGLNLRRIEMPSGLRFDNLRRIGEALAVEACDVVHTHGYKPNVLMALQPRREGRPAHVVTLHGWTSTGRWSMNALYESLDRALLQRADATVVVSESMRGRFSRAALEQARCIPNGVSSDQPPLSGVEPELRSFCESGPTVVSVGRLSQEKDQASLLRALAIAGVDSGLKAVFMGDGPLHSELRDLATRLGLQARVLFTGYVENAFRVFPLCRALVISSVIEGLPITLLEAMRAGLPVVSTPVGEIPAATGGEAGAWFFPVGNVDELARRLSEVLARPIDAENRASFARQRCERLYSTRRMASDYEEVYAVAFDHAIQRVS